MYVDQSGNLPPHTTIATQNIPLESSRNSIQKNMNFDLRVEFLLKTESGYPRDVEVNLFTWFLCVTRVLWQLPEEYKLVHIPVQ